MDPHKVIPRKELGVKDGMGELSRKVDSKRSNGEAKEEGGVINGAELT